MNDLNWTQADEPPDADTTVMIAIAHSDEPVWLGYFDGTSWWTVDHMKAIVTHWAETPAPPETT